MVNRDITNNWEEDFSPQSTKAAHDAPVMIRVLEGGMSGCDGEERHQRKRQQVGAVRGGKGAWVVAAVPLRKLLHDAVNLLGLTCRHWVSPT